MDETIRKRDNAMHDATGIFFSEAGRVHVEFYARRAAMKKAQNSAFLPAHDSFCTVSIHL
jgi:hypothetical protein